MINALLYIVSTIICNLCVSKMHPVMHGIPCIALSLGSFAKICAPALRLGWFQASTPDSKLLKTIFDRGLLDSSGGLNPLNAGIVEIMMETGTLQEHMDKSKKALGARAKAMVDAVKAAGLQELGC